MYWYEVKPKNNPEARPLSSTAISKIEIETATGIKISPSAWKKVLAGETALAGDQNFSLKIKKLTS